MGEIGAASTWIGAFIALTIVLILGYMDCPYEYRWQDWDYHHWRS